MQPITVYFPGLENTFGSFDPPSSTENSIIFPFNLSSKEFSRETYSTKLTQGRASVKDINQVLTLVELVLSRRETTWEMIIRFLLRIFIPFLLYRFLWDSDWLGRAASGILGAIYVFYLFFMIYDFIIGGATQTEKAKIDIKKIIEMMQPAFAERGLSWHIFDEHFCCWLELRKENLTGEQESLVEKDSQTPDSLNGTQDQSLSQQSVHERILENFKYTPIFTYELLYTENNQ